MFKIIHIIVTFAHQALREEGKQWHSAAELGDEKFRLERLARGDNLVALANVVGRWIELMKFNGYF